MWGGHIQRRPCRADDSAGQNSKTLQRLTLAPRLNVLSGRTITSSVPLRTYKYFGNGTNSPHSLIVPRLNDMFSSPSHHRTLGENFFSYPCAGPAAMPTASTTPR